MQQRFDAHRSLLEQYHALRVHIEAVPLQHLGYVLLSVVVEYRFHLQLGPHVIIVQEQAQQNQAQRVYVGLERIVSPVNADAVHAQTHLSVWHVDALILEVGELPRTHVEWGAGDFTDFHLCVAGRLHGPIVV